MPLFAEEACVRWLLRNFKSLLPRRRFDPWRHGSDPHTSPWDDRLANDQLREIIDSGEIKNGGLPRAD